jgi:hypothetical protein
MIAMERVLMHSGGSGADAIKQSGTYIPIILASKEETSVEVGDTYTSFFTFAFNFIALHYDYSNICNIYFNLFIFISMSLCAA